MTDDAGTLKPVKFEQKLDLRLNELRREDRCCDVRFEINGKIFPCHRAVLIAFSPYFDTMFNGNFKESGSGVIPLKEIEAETFEEILNAIYTGNIRLLPSNAYFILKASHLFLLKEVENTCVSYIKKNRSSVHYLVEICLFAKNILQHSLYVRCARTISKDLITYGQTDSFTLIPVDIFQSMLVTWYPKSYEEESTVLLILKWCKENRSKREDCHRLFASSRLQTKKFINPMLMARMFIIQPDDTSTEMESQISADVELDVNLDLNLYLNVVDVKTGQKGWGVLKTNDKFDTFILSSFHPSHSSYKSVCKVGSKMYCFEYFAKEKRNVFSSYDENNDKILLPVPEEVVEVYQIVSMETSIYLMTDTKKHFIVWMYDCNFKTWENLCKETDLQGYDSICEYIFLNGFFYVIMGKNESANQTLFSIDSRSFSVKYLIDWELSSSESKNDMLYGFDNELAICDRSCGNLLIAFFDVESKKWLDKESFMDFEREKFCLIHHKGSLYVIENNREIVNEKFDFKTETVEQLPSLPKRVAHLNNSNGTMVLATGQVFGSHSEATKN